jgi:hypothetical protein
MTTATPSTALATIQPAFTDAERLALAGYLAGYRGLTREAYALDLRQLRQPGASAEDRGYLHTGTLCLQVTSVDGGRHTAA